MIIFKDIPPERHKTWRNDLAICPNCFTIKLNDFKYYYEKCTCGLSYIYIINCKGEWGKTKNYWFDEEVECWLIDDWINVYKQVEIERSNITRAIINSNLVKLP
jgi:hypothetical protein